MSYQDYADLSGFSLTGWELKITGYLDCVNGDEIFNIFFYFQKYGMIGDNEIGEWKNTVKLSA